MERPEIKIENVFFGRILVPRWEITLRFLWECRGKLVNDKTPRKTSRELLSSTERSAQATAGDMKRELFSRLFEGGLLRTGS